MLRYHCTHLKLKIDVAVLFPISGCFWTEKVSGCIKGNDHWDGNANRLEDCQKKCEEERNFACLSIDYRDGRCRLSRFNIRTINPTSDYMQPCDESGWYYAERVNVASWTPEVSARIIENNIRSVTVLDMESCRLSAVKKMDVPQSNTVKKYGQCNLNDRKPSECDPSIRL